MSENPELKDDADVSQGRTLLTRLMLIIGIGEGLTVVLGFRTFIESGVVVPFLLTVVVTGLCFAFLFQGLQGTRILLAVTLLAGCAWYHLNIFKSSEATVSLTRFLRWKGFLYVGSVLVLIFAPSIGAFVERRRQLDLSSSTTDGQRERQPIEPQTQPSRTEQCPWCEAEVQPTEDGFCPQCNRPI